MTLRLVDTIKDPRIRLIVQTHPQAFNAADLDRIIAGSLNLQQVKRIALGLDTSALVTNLEQLPESTKINIPINLRVNQN